MYSDVNEKLEEIQEKINKIEEDDSNYTQNKRWKKLRQQQDLLYDFKRQEMENDERSL